MGRLLFTNEHRHTQTIDHAANYYETFMIQGNLMNYRVKVLANVSFSSLSLQARKLFSVLFVPTVAWSEGANSDGQIVPNMNILIIGITF